MQQIEVHGTLVNAVYTANRYVQLSFSEVERLLNLNPKPGFTIETRIMQEEVTLETLEKFRNRGYLVFYIKDTKIKNVSEAVDIEGDILEVIMVPIKAHLKRIGGFVNFEDEEIGETIGHLREEFQEISTVYLKEDLVMASHSTLGDEPLDSIVIFSLASFGVSFGFDNLLPLLKALEKIGGLQIQKPQKAVAIEC